LKEIPVELGLSDGRVTQILSGELEAGDEVVVERIIRPKSGWRLPGRI
jgi:hypothetical protein